MLPAQPTHTAFSPPCTFGEGSASWYSSSLISVQIDSHDTNPHFPSDQSQHSQVCIVMPRGWFLVPPRWAWVVLFRSLLLCALLRYFTLGRHMIILWVACPFHRFVSRCRRTYVLLFDTLARALQSCYCRVLLLILLPLCRFASDQCYRPISI